MSEDKDISLSELITRRMKQTVRSKDGRVLVNEDGTPMTIMEAIATTIVQNAMKGDTASILLARNLMQKNVTEEERRKSDEDYRLSIAEKTKAIEDELKEDGLWYGDTIEMRLLAGVLCEVERIESVMQDPGYDDIVTEIRKDGSQVSYINPLHSRLDELRKQIRQYRQQIWDKELERKRSGRISKDIEF